MAEHLVPSSDFLAQYNRLLEEFRALSRQMLLDGGGIGPLQTFEDGSPLGDTRFLNFGEGVNAVLTADGYVEVTASTGGGGGFDFIADANAGASDTSASPPIFLGIGEALTYLDSLGFTRAFGLVRDGTYTETGNWTNPGTVYLFGTSEMQSTAPIIWDHGDFSGSASTSWHIANVSLEFGTGVGKLSAFGGSGHFLHFDNCRFNLASLQAGFTVGNGDGSVYRSCQFVDIRRLGNIVELVNCDFQVVNTVSITIAGTSIKGTGLSRTAGPVTWACPATTHLEWVGGPNRQSPTSGGGALTLTRTSPLSFFVKEMTGGASMTIVIAGSPQSVALEGHFDSITLAAPSTAVGLPHIVNASTNNFDITGPAHIQLGIRSLSAAATRIFRGRNISGLVSSDNIAGSMSSGTLLNYINADGSTIMCAHDGTGISGTAEPFDMDASSANNYLFMPNLDAWPVAGTGGTANDNRVETTPAPAYVTGIDVEDEGVAQGTATTFDFVGPGVTAAEAGGVATITIPGGSATFDSPVASLFDDVGADGVDTDAARADHVHDRDNDARLHYVGIN